MTFGGNQEVNEGIGVQNLSSKLRRIYALLKKVQPVEDEIDVTWWGSYVILRPGKWHFSHFVLYNRTLYGRLLIPPGSYGLSWEIGSNEVEFEKGFGAADYNNDERLWNGMLTQIERRLKSAIEDVSKYNLFVNKKFPLSCRAGKIQRRLTWPKKIKSVLPIHRIRSLEKVLCDAKNRPALSQMTSSQCLETVAVAYDAVFKELRQFSPLDKYKRKADGRHGGLLDLPLQDAQAFLKWFNSSAWSGTHPWEIVFGHPHGIMISPYYHMEENSWTYRLWVDSLGWYVTAVKMAIALGEHKIPFEFEDSKKVLEVLEGLDEVDVGPDLYEVHYDDLKKIRRDALPQIRWDPSPQMALITPDQKRRIEKAETPEPSS